MSAGGKATEPVSTRLFLVVVASAVFVAVMTGSMVNVVLPLMRAQFGASAAQIGWVITGFSLAYAISVPLYGRISDFFSVRRVFTVGLLGFAAGGLICAFAPSLPVLVMGRIVQAAGERPFRRWRPSLWRRCCRPVGGAALWAWSPPAWASERRWGPGQRPLHDLSNFDRGEILSWIP